MSEIQDDPTPVGDEYALAGEEPEPASSTPVRGQPGPIKPLPRLWKTEPEPEDEPDEPPAKSVKPKKPVGKEASTPARPRSSSKPAARPARKKADADQPEGEKRVLIEETPRFDTVETRQRARLVFGGLVVFCVLIFGWNVFSLLFDQADELGLDPTVDMVPPDAMKPAPLPGLSHETEAAYMFDRARDHAKRGQTELAITRLTQIVRAYKGTPGAAEAEAALQRARQNRPLFPDRPYELAHGVGQPAPGTATRPDPAAPSSSHPISPNMAMPSPPISGHAPTSPIAMHPANVAPPANPSPQPVMPAAPAQVPGPSVAMGPGAAMPTTPPLPGTGGAATMIPVAPGPPAIPATSGTSPTNPPSTERTATLPTHPVRTLPPGFHAKSEAGVHASGWPMAIVGDPDIATMVLVPGGTFTMGSDRGDRANGPAHEVRLSTYYIDQHEVTNRQFRKFLEATNYHGRPPGKWLTDPKLRALPEDQPAVNVSYQDAVEYARWALKRLPTEAQWEMAARSADGRRYPWGDEPVKWSNPRSFRQVGAVMSVPEDVSPFGVFDLAGNAVEWVRDWYDPSWYGRLRDSTTLDPTGPPSKRQGIQRVIRGDSKEWLAYVRHGMDTDRRSPYIGFRCSLAVEGSEASALIVPREEKPNTPQPGAPPAGQTGGGDIPF